MSGKEKAKPIAYHVGIFDVFSGNPDLDSWNDDGFSETMWGLGYDMDCCNSFEEYVLQSPLKVKEYTNDREKKRNALYYLEHADRQIVGNYLFSYWRYLTHWAMYGYNEYEVDFLCRIISILENKYEKEGIDYENIDAYTKASSLPKMKLLGEDEGCRYYIEDYPPGFDEDVGIPTVVTEVKSLHTFSVCDADTSLELMGRFCK